jgi:putative DNA primase/helicase
MKRAKPVGEPVELREKALSEYREEKIEWLWRPFFPLSFVTPLEGEGEIGKSRLTRFMAARLTRGRTLPGQEKGHPPDNVLIVSFSEDPVSAVVKPQIRKMGGDQDRVFIVEQPFKLDDEGMTMLNEVMERVQPIMVILDPLSDYIPSKTNSYRDEEVRHYVMGPLTAMAKEYECAIVAIRHFKKGNDGGSKYRSAGSMAFTNVARATVACVEHPTERGIVIMGPNKANLVPKEEKVSLMFEIVRTEDGIGRLVWRGETHMSFDEIEEERKQQDKSPKTSEATRFLKEQLSKGPVLVETLKTRAEAYSFSWSTVDLARRKMGSAIKTNDGNRGAKATWELVTTDDDVSDH